MAETLNTRVERLEPQTLANILRAVRPDTRIQVQVDGSRITDGVAILPEGSICEAVWIEAEIGISDQDKIVLHCRLPLDGRDNLVG